MGPERWREARRVDALARLKDSANAELRDRADLSVVFGDGRAG